MSAIRKQSKLRWSYRNEKTQGGAIICTVWEARVGGFLLQVTNWPGTSTLDWSITIPGTDWRQCGDESRFEATVSILKDRLHEKATQLASRHPQP